MPPVTVDAIRTLLAPLVGPCHVVSIDRRQAVDVSIPYTTSGAASVDAPIIEAALTAAGYTDFDDPSDVVAHGGGKYTIELEVRA